MQSIRERQEDERRAHLAAGIAAYGLRVSAAEIVQETRGDGAVATARHLAMYLTYVVFAMSYGRVALAFGRDRSTVAYAVRRMEEWREDPAVDRWMQGLEGMLRDARELDASPKSPLAQRG